MDATVKVLCYKSKTLANGEHPLMVCICKDRKRKYQSIGFSIHPTHWDFKKNEPNELCPNRDEIRLLIQQKLYYLQKTILSKRIEGKDFTASSLLKSNVSSSCLHNNVEECFSYYIKMLKEQGRLRYAGMYMNFLIENFTGRFCFLSHTGCIDNSSEECRDVYP